MGDLDKNIHRKEQSPFGEIIINPIEKDKREKEETYTSLKNATRMQIVATLLAYFKKMLHSFASRKQQFTDEQTLLENLLIFKQHLVSLSKEDLSHEPKFSEELSECWNKINNIYTPMGHKKRPSDLMKKLKFFISQVQNFPIGADHTLGFYFTAYAGKDWIPFPFMELLQYLHNEYQAGPIISVLHNWIHLLDEMLIL